MTCYQVPPHTMKIVHNLEWSAGCTTIPLQVVNEAHNQFRQGETEDGLFWNWQRERRHQDRLNLGQQRLAIAASLTVTLAAAAAFQSVPSPLNYEGRVQLAGILPLSASTSTPRTAVAMSAPASALGRTNIAPPDLVEVAHPLFLRNPEMIAAVQTTLAQQGVTVTPRDLTTQLSAQTNAQGWLELHYRDSDPERVQQVLSEVAQWYTTQVPTCEIQACNDVAFIETQIPILTRHQAELKQSLAELQQTMQRKLTQDMGQAYPTAGDRSSSSLPDSVADYDPVDYSLRKLTTQHRDVRDYGTQLDQAIAETYNHLNELQTGMGLASAKPQSGFALLRHVMPEYTDWLNRWQKSDRQLLAAQLNIHINLNVDFDGTQLSPGLDFNDFKSLKIKAEQQKVRLRQMEQAVSALSQPQLSQMATPLRELLMEEPIRIGYLEEWLDTVHRLQLLELRRQTVADFQEAIVAQSQEWQQLHQAKQQLRRQLATTEQTLATYAEKYAIAQRQVNKHRLAWQVVAPPEMVQRPFSSDKLFSHFSHRPQPLMTLGTP